LTLFILLAMMGLLI